MGFYKWTESALNVLRERYVLDGPTALAEELGTSLASVQAKAKRLGVRPKHPTKPYEWTEEMLATLNRLYPTADRETLVKEVGVPYHIIQRRAHRIGLVNITGRERGARTKSERCVSCDIHYFDEWKPSMAYVLGFIFADGNITKRQGEIIVGLASSDIEVIHYIKDELKSTRTLHFRDGGIGTDGQQRQESVFLTLASRILIARAMELGIKPHKTYNDDPFPEVPEDCLPHFIRGYFDGDGTAFLAGNGTFRLAMVGSPRFITGIRDALAKHANMRTAPVRIEKGKRCSWARITWGAWADTYRFREYIYPEGFGFCLKRKKQALDNWFASFRFDDPNREWTKRERIMVGRLYRSLGPVALGEWLGRSAESVVSKAKDLKLL